MLRKAPVSKKCMFQEKYMFKESGGGLVLTVFTALVTHLLLQVLRWARFKAIAAIHALNRLVMLCIIPVR